MKGITEMREIFDYLSDLNISTEVELDLTLARGLNYYTGAIFEVKSKDVQIGSITGGGRYDDLTGIFGLPGVSGVGISFGADRIYDVMTQLNQFGKENAITTQVMFSNFGKSEEKFCLPLIKQLRAAGISAEIYPGAEKMKKQMNYANRKNIRFVALVGEAEIAEGVITLKDMDSGEQAKIPAGNLVEGIQERL
jgi:histidyl-tRNA synthetase